MAEESDVSPAPEYLPLQKLVGWLLLDVISFYLLLPFFNKAVASRFAGGFFGVCVAALVLYLPTPIPEGAVLFIAVLPPIIGQVAWMCRTGLPKSPTRDGPE